jgi:GNAT superfamily N-acetyltransferase
MEITYDVDLAPDSKDEDIVVGGLQAHNAQLTNHETRHYSVFARNSSQDIVGGALVYVGRDSAFVSVLWVNDALRRQGIGRDILQAVEKEATKRACAWVKLDTYAFQTPEFYLKCGYEIYGEVKDYTCGQSKIFLRKKI